MEISVRTLLINNYDSFTYNLYQLIWALSRTEPLVINNDEMSWSDLCRRSFANIVISPGPGRPDRAHDFGISRDAILDGRWPLLGVCLGHQGICDLFGGQVVHAPEPMHGRLTQVRHDGSDLFDDIPSPFRAVRYHSLIAKALPECLATSAWTDDGLVMAVRHVGRPLWGVQFHPESIASEYGSKILSNFLKCQKGSTRSSCMPPASSGSPSPRQIRIFAKPLDLWLPPERVFSSLYDDVNPCFWLDSSAVIEHVSRFSFIGDSLGPLSEVLSYDVTKSVLHIRRGEDLFDEPCSIFDYLDRRLTELHVKSIDSLPFDFAPGYVGYFGYEMKAETGGTRAHKSASPDAQFIFADRVICFDHFEQRIWLICCDDLECSERANAWFDLIENRLFGLDLKGMPATAPQKVIVGQFNPRHPDETYLNLIEKCMHQIRDGESYEICLTNQITAAAQMNDLQTYLILRATNPAPYSALLRFGETRVLCSSPERFIRCERGRKVESKPIKGTIRRGLTSEDDIRLSESLRTSEKERAENLMIVDLIRNDMGRVCELGSVTVPSLFAIESYATVHQLVSTICGRLKDDRSPVDLVRSMFPGGSMTGAPKVRTMEIVDRLEQGPRGIYSGSLGYLSITGTVDLNIVIRTIILNESSVSIGVGGAITALSAPSDELEEIKLKAKALLNALNAAAAFLAS